MPTVKPRACPDGHVYHVLLWSDGSAMPQDNADPDDESLDCPVCGAVAFVEYLGVGQGINMNKGGPVSYPYWDDTLGAMVESHSHMLKLAKAKGLRPMESRDTLRRTPEQERAWSKSADEGGKLLARQEDEPWYREMKDKIGIRVRNKRTGDVETVFHREQFQDFARERRLSRRHDD
jgi:hypothetical protein